jgi:thiol-disulfide isomerase/thioredoxin
MRKLLLFFIVTLLLMIGCNRFDNTFESDDTNEPEEISLAEYFVNFNDSLQIIETDNLEPIMAFYPANYLNSGSTSETVLEFYTDLLNTGYNNISATLLANSNHKVQWQLLATDAADKAVVDSTIVDVVNSTNTAFIGNQSLVSFADYVSNFSNTLRTALVSNNINLVMSYYAEEYNNNGMDKAAMRIYYNSLAAVTTSNLLVTVNYAKPYENEFSYWIYDEDGVINANNIDYAEAVPDSFLITGSQIGGENNNTQKVLVELGTGIWCSNCPYAEAALHILKEELGDQFYYIEYHINDVLQVDGNLEILSYYGDTTLPIAKFQGQTTLSHNQEATVDYYRNALNIYLAQEAKAFLTNQSVSMSEDILTGEVDISLEDIETTNLFLKYSLVEKESDKTNFAGENCLQVVLANGSMSLENADLTQPVTYNLDLPAYLPEDIVLYLWLQTLDEPYDEETCKVHNIIEVNL